MSRSQGKCCRHVLGKGARQNDLHKSSKVKGREDPLDNFGGQVDGIPAGESILQWLASGVKLLFLVNSLPGCRCPFSEEQETNLYFGRVCKSIGVKDLNSGVVDLPCIFVLLLEARNLAQAKVTLAKRQNQSEPAI